MSDSGPTRRQVLRATAASGAVGLASGVGTTAILGDAETASGNAVRGGELDLEVLTATGVTPCDWDPSFDGQSTGDGATLDEPSGVLGVALSACENPATVTLGLAASDDAAGDLLARRAEPESRARVESDERAALTSTATGTVGGPATAADADTDRPDPSTETADRGGVDTASEVETNTATGTVTGTGTEATADESGTPTGTETGTGEPGAATSTEGTADGAGTNAVGGSQPASGPENAATAVGSGPARVTVSTCDGGERTRLASGTLDRVVGSLDGGVTLGRECTSIGKLEVAADGQSFVAEGGEAVDGEEGAFAFGDVTVTVLDAVEDDGQIVAVDLAVDGGRLCRVDVKGGGPPAHGGGNGPDPGSGVATYPVDCAAEATGLYAPVHATSGRQTGVSHVELFACDGPATCVPCASDGKAPYALFVEWTGLTEETAIDVQLTATQCRYRTGGSA